MLFQNKLKLVQLFEFFQVSLLISVSIKCVFNVWNGHLSDLKVELLQKKWKSGGEMTLMEIVLVLICIETQKVQ